MAIIDMQEVTFAYPPRNEDGETAPAHEAVKDVTLSVPEGAFIGILGANGSGKSTLARHMNALLTPARGTVFVDGMDTGDEDALWEIRKTAGMVFQNPDNQIIASVVEEDVGFGPENIGVPTEEIWARVDESLKTVGMEAYRKNSPNRLSGGQKQRVAIAGVLAVKPRCLILDEATAMLDPAGRKEVLETVRRLNKEAGMTVIWITHYMEEIVEADRVYVMHNGAVVMQGTPRELFSQPEKLEAYRLCAPDIARLAKMLTEKGLPLPGGILTTEELVEALCRLRSNT